MSKTARRDDPEQSRLFLKKARELQADKEKPDADALMRLLHKKPPEPRHGRSGRNTKKKGS
jgi:hypothetical protein